MTRPLPPRYFLASILLLLVVVALYAASETRRTQRELARQLEAKGLALAEALETYSRSAIRGNALMEELIAQRLLDNARLVDHLLLAGPLDPEALAGIAAANGLRRIDLLDREGRPAAPPSPARGMMMTGEEMKRAREEMMRARERGEPPERHRTMMRLHMWGRRWSSPPPDAAGGVEPPPAVRDRRFWEGDVFGVAVGARSFPGIIAVHADADYVLNFRKEVGVERQIEELGRQSGVEEVALLGPDLTVLAHSDPGRIGSRDGDPALEQALGARAPVTRVTRREGREVLEVVRPLALDGSRLGLLRIGLSKAPMERAWRRDLQSAVALGLAVLVAGAVGMGAIFYMQQRHLNEVRRLEAEVDRRERLSSLGNLAAGVAHEVRNPLNAIAVGLQRLRGEFVPAAAEGEYTRFVDLMQGEVRRLNGIVEEFLSLARPLQLRLEAVQAGELLEEVSGLIAADADARAVRIALGAPSDLQAVRLDRDHVKQVLLNLVVNALEAMPRGGTLSVTASARGDSLVLAVEDTGDGVPPDLLPRIFEPYVTTKAKGMGLGLAVARRIVEAHGGRIDVESRPGQGTRFEVTFPRNPRPS